jgi:hypothetical protein
MSGEDGVPASKRAKIDSTLADLLAVSADLSAQNKALTAVSADLSAPARQ